MVMIKKSDKIMMAGAFLMIFLAVAIVGIVLFGGPLMLSPDNIVTIALEFPEDGDLVYNYASFGATIIAEG
jgi:hypothetical protein